MLCSYGYDDHISYSMFLGIPLVRIGNTMHNPIRTFPMRFQPISFKYHLDPEVAKT